MNGLNPKPTMSVKEMASLMGISTPRAYDLTHIEGFPVIIMGKRRIVLREGFFKWLSDNAGKAVL